MIDRFVAAGLRPRLLGDIDVQGALFRFRSVAETAGGVVVDEFVDVGEVDADGRIACIYVMRP